MPKEKREIKNWQDGMRIYDQKFNQERDSLLDGLRQIQHEFFPLHGLVPRLPTTEDIGHPIARVSPFDGGRLDMSWVFGHMRKCECWLRSCGETQKNQKSGEDALLLDQLLRLIDCPGNRSSDHCSSETSNSRYGISDLSPELEKIENEEELDHPVFSDHRWLVFDNEAHYLRLVELFLASGIVTPIIERLGQLTQKQVSRRVWGDENFYTYFVIRDFSSLGASDDEPSQCHSDTEREEE